MPYLWDQREPTALFREIRGRGLAINGLLLTTKWATQADKKQQRLGDFRATIYRTTQALS